MNRQLRESYAHCRRVARRAASNFYYSFYLLPKPQRDAMFALYAFLRHTDDIVDTPPWRTSGDVRMESQSPNLPNLPTSDFSPDPRIIQLQTWQAALNAAWASETNDPLLPALVHTAKRYELPQQYFYDAIDGARMDLDQQHYATFADLHQYCYRAAAVVGLACIRIWGCRDPRADELAEACGLAFQLTNILRDVADDAHRGRIYLPQEDLARFECREADILAGKMNDNIRRLIRFQVERAEEFYRQASSLGPLLPAGGRRAWRVMMVTYRAILNEIRHRQFDVFGPPIRFSRMKRISLLARGLLGRSANDDDDARAHSPAPLANRRSA